MNKTIMAAIGAFLLGGLMVGGAVSNYFLWAENVQLEEQLESLQVKKEVLSGELSDVQAESIRLKEEALKNNVFLGK